MAYRKLIIMVSVLLCSLSTRAQSPPDMDAIRDSISNPSSKYFYQQLFDRYRLQDSTLTQEDFHYLYYGYGEQVNYMPLLDNSARAELEDIMSGYSTPTAADYRRAIALASAILEIEPFNPRDINALAYLYAMTGNEEEAAKLMHNLEMIVATIKATGSGLSEESPWWVIYFDHAEDVVDLMGLDWSTPIILSRAVEFIPLSGETRDGVKGYYFNYSEIYARKPDYLDNVKAPKRKMNFNPLESDKKFTY